MPLNIRPNKNFERDLQQQMSSIADQIEAATKRELANRRALTESAAEMVIEEVLLEKEQEELLCIMVEASRKLPKGKRDSFMGISTINGSFLEHDGLSERLDVHLGDLEILERSGLLVVRYGGAGTPNYDVSPRGYRYYSELMQTAQSPIEQVEKRLSLHLDGIAFSQRYPVTSPKVRQLFALLAADDVESNLTRVGHDSREVMQHFTEELYQRLLPSEQPLDLAKTKNKLAACLAKVSSGTTKNLLDRSFAYWEALNDAVQKQEHGSAREKEEISVEDARRVAFHTLFLIHEIDRVFG